MKYLSYALTKDYRRAYPAWKCGRALCSNDFVTRDIGLCHMHTRRTEMRRWLIRLIPNGFIWIVNQFSKLKTAKEIETKPAYEFETKQPELYLWSKD